MRSPIAEDRNGMECCVLSATRFGRAEACDSSSNLLQM